MRDKVVLGLSGGVDSAVAARLLLDGGCEVFPLWLDIGLGGREDAAAVAAGLGLSLVQADIRAALEERVCAPFAAEYLAGRTPLPCARCNPEVKFPALLRHADAVGARYVATGHYARTGRGEGGRAALLRGQPANDQSYLLARLSQEILQNVIFPLGDYEKTQIRALAADFGLPVAHKPDSMEICFIPDGDYAAWLEGRGGTPPPGNFVDGAGNVLGRHRGIHRYTVGQRRGLGTAFGARMFVCEIRPAENEVVLCKGEALYKDEVLCGELNWISIAPPEGPLEVTVRLRHSKAETAATLFPEGTGARLLMHTPARAPTPGQLAVFYRGDCVLGSGWIF